MVKVRFDIVVITFLSFFLVILGNSFVNINKAHYESVEKNAYMVGYPPSNEALAVTNMEQLAMATEMGYPFALVVDSDKVKKTNYYLPLNGGDEIEKMPRFMIWYNRAMGANYYDRVYVVELADKQKVAVLMFDGAVDLSEDTAVLPISEAEFLTEKTDYLEELDQKYDLAESAAEQWYVNASGKELTIFTDFDEKAEALKTTSLTIVGVLVVLYSIISTVYFFKLRKASFSE